MKRTKELWVANFRDLKPAEGAKPIIKDRVYALADGSTTQLYLYDEIGGWGITADEFTAQVRAIGTPNIEMHINSPGGDVFDGLAILNSLRAHAAKVTTVIDGLAASAASFIAMAGEDVQMMPNSQMMVHDALGLCVGNATDMQLMVDLLNSQSDNIADVYARKAGGTKEDWRAVMKAETWYGPAEAVAAGLADSVVELGDQDAPTNTHRRSMFDLAVHDRRQEPDPEPDQSFDWSAVFRGAFEEAR